MIQVVNYERVNEGSKIGYVDIYLPKRKEYISHIVHFQKGDRKWFGFPCYAKVMADGTKKYFPYWRLDPDLHNGQLLEALAEPVKQYCLKHKIADIEPLDLSLPLENECPF